MDGGLTGDTMDARFSFSKKEKNNKKLTMWQNREKAGNGVGTFSYRVICHILTSIFKVLH